MAESHPTKTYSCSVCSKVFLSKQNLVYHQVAYLSLIRKYKYCLNQELFYVVKARFKSGISLQILQHQLDNQSQFDRPRKDSHARDTV